jgi:hypothetical protein
MFHNYWSRAGLLAAFGLAVLVAGLWFAFGRGSLSPRRDYLIERIDTRGSSQAVVLLSRAYQMDQIYESMTGPRSVQPRFQLLDGRSEPELLWITGIRSDVLAADGQSSAPPEFFCHSNLTFSEPHRRDGGSRFTRVPDRRLVTLVPGLLELKLPKGFGVPVYSDEGLEYLTMALNLNEPASSRRVRFKTTISFVAESEVPSNDRMTPLFRRALYSHESAEGNDLTQGAHDTHTGHGAASALGAATHWPVPRSGDASTTIHWLVSPGHFESRVDVTGQLDLDEHTTAHFATAHLHPYAKSVSLVDKTRGEAVFTITSTDYQGRRGVAEMETWVSKEGAGIYPDRRYELLTVYENTTGKPIDAMCIVYMYMLDRRFSGNR